MLSFMMFGFIFIIEIAHMSGLEYFTYGCIYESMTWLFEMYAIFSCDVLLLKFLCMSIEIYLNT